MIKVDMHDNDFVEGSAMCTSDVVKKAFKVSAIRQPGQRVVQRIMLGLHTQAHELLGAKRCILARRFKPLFAIADRAYRGQMRGPKNEHGL